MSRQYGGPGNFEQRFRQAEIEQDLHMLREVARGWNQTGLIAIAVCAFGLLCFGWRMGWTFW